MDKTVWTQLILTMGTVLGGMFLTVRYAMGIGSKKEKLFLDYLRDAQTQQLEYYESKNGHLERISQIFSESINKNTKAVDKLSQKIKLIK